MADGAASDLGGIDEGQFHCGPGKFVRRGGVVEVAGIVGEPGCEDRLGRRERVDGDVVVGEIVGRALSQMLERGLGPP